MEMWMDFGLAANGQADLQIISHLEPIKSIMIK